MAIEFPSTLSAAKQQFITDFYQTSDEPESVDKVRRSEWCPLDLRADKLYTSSTWAS